jgi:hypothetical protein
MVAIEGEIFRGRDGIVRYFASLSNAWELFLILPDRFRDLTELVIMLGGLRGRGTNSGVPVGPRPAPSGGARRGLADVSGLEQVW